MNRRAFFSALAACSVGVALRPAAAGVETITPPSPRYPFFGIPRGVVVEMPPAYSTAPNADLCTLQGPCHTHSFTTPGSMNVQMISTGASLVTLESEEGQRIYAERRFDPVNVRGDGSIRHRQHHPVDFPPRR